jgi:hypothetical protein
MLKLFKSSWSADFSNEYSFPRFLNVKPANSILLKADLKTHSKCLKISIRHI